MNIIMTGKKKIERREYFTVGLPLLIGTTVSMIPKSFFQMFPSTLASLISNGLVMGIVLSLLFEHLFFRQRKENY
jgi:xanthine/uracil permease